MKAQKVYESMSFRRDGDSRSSLGVGRDALLKQWWEDLMNDPKIPSNSNKFSYVYNDILRKVIALVKEEGADWVDVASGTSGGWARDKEYVGRNSVNIHFEPYKGVGPNGVYYVTLMIDSDGEILVKPSKYLADKLPEPHWKKFNSTVPMGYWSASPTRVIDNLVEFLEYCYAAWKSFQPTNESMEFQRGISSKRALQVGTVEKRRGWWADLRKEYSPVDISHEILLDINQYFLEAGVPGDEIMPDEIMPIGVGNYTIGLEVRDTEYELDFTPDGYMYHKGKLIGNYVDDPEGTVYNLIHGLE